MPTHQLALSNIHRLENGKVAAAFAHAIAQCTRDVEDRCGDKAKRTVTLVCELTPELDAEGRGVLDNVNVQFRVKSTVPVRRSPAYKMLPQGKTGSLMFQEASPFDPRQTEFPYDPDNKKKEAADAAAEGGESGGDNGGDTEVEM